jgi:serine protease Do
MFRNSDAYNAGLRPGDIIIGFNGQAVTDPSQLYRLAADAEIGTTAALRVWREGRALDLKVPIASSARPRR